VAATWIEDGTVARIMAQKRAEVAMRNAAVRRILGKRTGASDPEETSTLRIRTRGVASGDYLVRVQVDGAESPLDLGPDGQFESPQATFG
jgi:hypothetical protein